MHTWLEMDYVHDLTECMPGVEFVRPSAQKPNKDNGAMFSLICSLTLMLEQNLLSIYIAL